MQLKVGHIEHIKNEIGWLKFKVENEALSHKEISSKLSKLNDEISERQYDDNNMYDSDYSRNDYHEKMLKEYYIPVMNKKEFKKLSRDDKKKIFDIWDYTEAKEFQMLSKKVDKEIMIRELKPLYDKTNSILEVKKDYSIKDKVKYYNQRIYDNKITENQRKYAARRIKELAI
jgi:hypothetical protein